MPYPEQQHEQVQLNAFVLVNNHFTQSAIYQMTTSQINQPTRLLLYLNDVRLQADKNLIKLSI